MTAHNDRLRGRPAVPKPVDVEVTLRSIGMKPVELLRSIGEVAHFSLDILRDLPRTRRYSSEIFRQAGILIISSGMIIWAMQFVMGNICGVEGHYLLKQVGAPLYSGVFNSYCGLREMAPYMWGYILSAKVGCGIVAELGSMRIAEEIDAMETMGIESRSYLVGTRLIAAWIAMPFLFIIGLGVMYLGGYTATVVQLGGVSSGGYLYIFWLFQNPLDLTFAFAKVMAMGTVIVLVGCYFGYTASGGPVGVGRNTARSMMVNMVLVHIIGLIGTVMFWGVAPNAPIAN